MTAEMLTAKRVNDTAPLRRRCVDDMSFWIEGEAKKAAHKGVQLARLVSLMVFNLLANMMFSRDLIAGPDSEDGSEFFAAMEGMMEWSGHANAADVFPWLRRVDPQGLMRRMERDMGKAMRIVSKFVNERVNARDLGIEQEKKRSNYKDFLDVLLEFEGNGKDEPAKLSNRQLVFFVLVSIITSSH